MNDQKIPPHIAKYLGKPQLREACAATVAAAEAHGYRMRVIRITLGDPKAPAFGQQRVIYETPERGRTV